MTKANDLFEQHLEYLRTSAKEKGIHFADILDMVADAPPGNVALAEMLLTESPDKRAAMIIKRYRIQFYGWLADEGARIADKLIEARNLQHKNLAKGRPLAVKARQEKSAKKQTDLIEAIKALFDKPEKPGWGWTNPEIVTFLKKGNYGYADTTLMGTVKIEAAKYRKARKEQQASKFLKR